MTRMLILVPEASLSTLLQEILELEGYEMIDAANSYEGLQATHVPLSRRASHWMSSISSFLVTWVWPDPGPKETFACHGSLALMKTQRIDESIHS